MEKRELIKQANMLVLLEEQEAKKRQMEEELKKWTKEQEEKMAAIQVEVEKEEEEKQVEEEVPLERRRGGASTIKEEEIQKTTQEWTAHLEMGEDTEAELAIPQAEREAARRELEAERDPVRRKAKQEEQQRAWKCCLSQERIRRLEAAERAEQDLKAAETRMGKIREETEIATKLDTLTQSVESLLIAHREQTQYICSLEVKIDVIRAGFKDFARDMMKYLVDQVHLAISKSRSHHAVLATPKEEEPSPPRREKVKALRDEATSFARSLARAANCENDMVTYSRLTPLSKFLKSLRERFSDVTRGLKASDKLQMIHTRKWKSVHALKSAMDELIAVPGHGVTDAQLLNLFYRALPENIQGHFFEKKNQQGTTYDTLSPEAVAFAAQTSLVTMFWHKDLSKGKTWKGRTISDQIKAKDSLILTMEKGGADEVPYSDIEWGLEEQDSGVGQGRTYGRPQEGGQKSGQNGRAPSGRGQGGQGVGSNGNRQAGGRGGPLSNRPRFSRSPPRQGWWHPGRPEGRPWDDLGIEQKVWQ
ncbi:hypothetical protein CBR_g30575 [Chara braunii]|uniref:Uncharacterized protein n=1 Tax=Chara braunii TaxID=69332 RepID=A0A388LD34_CHABU|nr:hypothetical protein CBR_g30575 [Chara braunii]|eukprot:GBG80208.1 hypothetical protein CBR_g30575 [Chara braunii]